jgi:hypothetical protein
MTFLGAQSGKARWLVFGVIASSALFLPSCASVERTPSSSTESSAPSTTPPVRVAEKGNITAADVTVVDTSPGEKGLPSESKQYFLVPGIFAFSKVNGLPKPAEVPDRFLVGRAFDPEGNMRYYITPIFQLPRATRECETFSIFDYEQDRVPDGQHPESLSHRNSCQDDEAILEVRVVRTAPDATGLELLSRPAASDNPERVSLGIYKQIAKLRYYKPIMNDIATPVFRDFRAETQVDEIPANTVMMGLDPQTGRVAIDPVSSGEPNASGSTMPNVSTDDNILLPRPLHPHVAWILPDGTQKTGWIDMESFVRGTWTDQRLRRPSSDFERPWKWSTVSRSSMLLKFSTGRRVNAASYSFLAGRTNSAPKK